MVVFLVVADFRDTATRDLLHTSTRDFLDSIRADRSKYLPPIKKRSIFRL